MIHDEGYRGIYKGFWATFWRDVPGWGVYFYVYEKLKNILGVKNVKDGDLGKRLLCGGIAG